MKLKFFILHSSFFICLLALPALGNLTATVQPGYTFSDGEDITVANLNLLGQPTIEVTGTLDGSASLAAGSVNGTLLADSVVDTNTTTWTASVPRSISVVPGGLVGASSGIRVVSSLFQLYADTNYFQLSSNSIATTNTPATGSTTNWLTLRAGALTDTNFASATIKPNKLTPDTTNNATGWLLFSNGVGTVVGFPAGYGLTRPDGTNLTVAQTNWFTLTNVAFTTSAGMITNTAHNLGAVPGYVKWVAVCLTNDVGYEVGDEVNTSDFDGGTPPYFIGGANSTNVFIVSSGGGISVANKYSGARGTSLTVARWRLKCYARP